MNKKKSISEIISKYKSKDTNIACLSKSILDDKRYLKQHQVRTCKNSFDLIPKFPLHVYGDMGMNLLFSKNLSNSTGWDTEDWSEYRLNLEEIIEDMLTMTYILSSIFYHSKDKESKSRAESSFINVEPVKDFIIFNKYFIETYDHDISSSLSMFVSYSHCQRYCDKISNFLEELRNQQQLLT